MTRAHYVKPGGGVLRVSPCGVLCRAGGPIGEEKDVERGTSRLIYVRGRACVTALRDERTARENAAFRAYMQGDPSVYTLPKGAKFGLWPAGRAKLEKAR